MASQDSTSAQPSVDYDIVTGRPRPMSGTGRAKAATSPKKGATQTATASEATSAQPSVDYDIVTGQYRTQTLSGTGNLSGQNEDSMGATMLGNEIKERFSSMRDAFLKMDANRDGRISVNEIRNLCKQWNIPLAEANRVLAAADRQDLDANGNLDFNEFAKRFDPDLAYVGDEPLQATQPGGGAAYKARDERVCGGGGGWNWEDEAGSGGSPSKTMQKKGGKTAGAAAPRSGPKLSEKVFVYGTDDDAGTSVVCELLTSAGIDFERRDVDSDRSFEEPMRASGFKGGEIGLPIVVMGGKAFWDFNPDDLLSKLEACQASTPAGSGSKAASAIRGVGGSGGGGHDSGDADRIKALEAELAASKGREAKLEARVRELEEALKAATRVMASGSGGGGGGGGGATAGGGGGGGGAKAPPSRAVAEEDEEEEEAVPDNGLKVYGRSDCAKTQAVVKELKKQRIDFSLLDMDKDKSWKEIVAKNGGPSGAVPPPVVVFGSSAWWEEPTEGIAVHFPSFLVNQLQKQGFGAQQATLMHVLEKDVTIDEEIAERFHSMQDAFLKMDMNRDGRVTKDEIRTMCKQWNIPASEADRVLGEADFDSNGTLDFREFARRFRNAT